MAHREPFRVNIRWGHLDRMPTCKHGRVEDFCACWDAIADTHPQGGDVKQATSLMSGGGAKQSPESPPS